MMEIIIPALAIFLSFVGFFLFCVFAYFSFPWWMDKVQEKAEEITANDENTRRFNLIMVMVGLFPSFVVYLGLIIGIITTIVILDQN